MNINVPPSLAPLSHSLGEFFNGMVHKLHVNSHKNAITGDDIDGLLDKLTEEAQEFREQRLKDATDPNMLAETWDVANFAFLLYAYLRAQGLQDLRERFLDEYFDVDIHTGKVFAKKSRPGSPHKPGERVIGSLRGGVRCIRAQNGATGVAISIPIRDIVWWKATGKWPEGRLSYKPNSYMAINQCRDSFENLQLAPASAAKLPFVSQYKPRGKENTKNYGRWVYRRRHMFKLVCVGYWDTAEEAASEGLKSWKRKIASV